MLKSAFEFIVEELHDLPGRLRRQRRRRSAKLKCPQTLEFRLLLSGDSLFTESDDYESDDFDEEDDDERDDEHDEHDEHDHEEDSDDDSEHSQINVGIGTSTFLTTAESPTASPGLLSSPDLTPTTTPQPEDAGGGSQSDTADSAIETSQADETTNPETIPTSEDTEDGAEQPSTDSIADATAAGADTPESPRSSQSNGLDGTSKMASGTNDKIATKSYPDRVDAAASGTVQLVTPHVQPETLSENHQKSLPETEDSRSDFVDTSLFQNGVLLTPEFSTQQANYGAILLSTQDSLMIQPELVASLQAITDVSPSVAGVGIGTTTSARLSLAVSATMLVTWLGINEHRRSERRKRHTA